MLSASDADYVRRLLAIRSEQCPVCAYDLQQLTEARCPECGSALSMRVVIRDLGSGWWIAGIVSAALPLGFYSCFSLFALIAAIKGISSRSEVVGALCFLVLSACHIAALRFLIRRRRAPVPKHRQDFESRSAIVISLGSFVLVLIIMFSLI